MPRDGNGLDRADLDRYITTPPEERDRCAGCGQARMRCYCDEIDRHDYEQVLSDELAEDAEPEED